MTKSKYSDKRGKRIVYFSRCILNQNLRFPGIAVKNGAITELIEPLLKNGIGIEQLPCLERMGWGGISRKSFFKFLPITLSYTGTRLFPIVKFFAKIWIFKFKRLCKKEAFKIIDQIEDYVNSGYSILGIIASNDSPTCGITKTIDLIKSAYKYKELGFKLEDFKNPEFEKMRVTIPNLCEDGTGLFMAEILKELRKRNMIINVIGFDPWNNLRVEAERIVKKLNLNP